MVEACPFETMAILEPDPHAVVNPKPLADVLAKAAPFKISIVPRVCEISKEVTFAKELSLPLSTEFRILATQEATLVCNPPYDAEVDAETIASATNSPDAIVKTPADVFCKMALLIPFPLPRIKTVQLSMFTKLRPGVPLL